MGKHAQPETPAAGARITITNTLVDAPAEQPQAPAEQLQAPAEPSAGVYALAHFECALQHRSYRKGDQVVGWNSERAQRYARAGLVRIVEE